MENELDDLLNDPEINLTLEEIKSIEAGLKTAREFGLEAEVVHWALQTMKADPTLSPSEAFYYGVLEWIK